MDWEDRFWAKVEEDPTTGCWNWLAQRDHHGYGRFYTECRMPSRRAFKAHRIAYELVVGVIPLGLSLDHLCRNTSCVNPSHLEPVTHRENVLRGESLWAIQARKTHCPRGHPYSGDNLVRRRNKRECRICQRQTSIERGRRYRARRKKAA